MVGVDTTNLNEWLYVRANGTHDRERDTSDRRECRGAAEHSPLERESSNLERRVVLRIGMPLASKAMNEWRREYSNDVRFIVCR